MSLSQLVNRVASDVGRPVVLEDRRQRIVAYSPHADTIDPVRAMTILRHRADPEIGQWLQELGIYRSVVSTRVPGNERLQMLPRLCVPVLSDSFALGYLWFIESPDALPIAAVERAGELASQIGAEWTRLEEDEMHARVRDEEALRALLSDDEAVVREAASVVAERLGVSPGATARAYVVTARAADSPAAQSALERGARLAAAAFPAAVGLMHRGHAIIVEAPPRFGAADVEESAARTVRVLEEQFGGAGTVAVGVGSLSASLIDLRASYGEARRALRVAGAFGLDGTVALWDGLGPYRGFYAAAEHGLTAADFHPGLRRLQDERDGDVLWATLQSYLRTGGRAQESAAELLVHRSSLYHRLGRIESLLGVDLQDGVQRLGLHMAVMLTAAADAGPGWE